MPVRLFTLREANGVLEDVARGIEAAQGVLARLREVRDQLVDLRIIWGEKIHDATCPDHAEYAAFHARFTDLERELAETTQRIAVLGCEVKDVEQGLVDFYASRGEEVVFLCWKKGEAEIGYWHRVEDGYGGRQPVEKF